MILIAPTAFKGTLTASDAAQAMARGARAALADRGDASGSGPAGGLKGGGDVELRVVPLSDGGNGLLDALEAAAGGKARGVRVAGPLGTSVTACYLVQDERVVVETAEACGIHLVPAPLRNPLRATTHGVGDLLLAASEAGGLDADVEKPVSRRSLVVGLGGSATVDAGAGMVSALGWRLLDDAGAPIPGGGQGLLRLHAIEPPPYAPPLPPPVVLADVTNPLVGPDGAAAVYAPQKGASPSDVEILERALARWARVVERELGRDVSEIAGGGAAGGLGAAFAAFLDAPPRRGAEWMLEAVDFDRLLREARVVVTGEGAWDAQSSMGKVTGEVVARARAAGVPVLIVAGSADGSPGAGVEVAAGGGDELDAGDVADLVRRSLPGLLADASTS